MDSFYIFQGDGPVQGPYTESEIRSRIDGGSLSIEGLQICAEKSNDWSLASNHPALRNCQSVDTQKTEVKKEGETKSCLGCLVVIIVILVLLAILGFFDSRPSYKPKTPVDRYLENKQYYDRRY